LLGEIGIGLLDGPLRLLHLGFELLQRGCEVPCVHTRDHLTGFDHVALVAEDFGDPPGKLGGDVDLVGFDAAVARGNPRRQLRPGMLPPIERSPGPAGHDGDDERNPKPAAAHRKVSPGRHSDGKVCLRRCRHEVARSRRRDVDTLGDGGHFGGICLDLLAHLVSSR
jgi:hypothetical protein